MADKTKLVDYSFSTSESEEEPPPKKRAVGVVKPISQPIPEESAEIPENPKSPGNPEIPEENQQIIFLQEENPAQPIIILSSETSDSDTISVRTARTFGKLLHFIKNKY